MDKRKLLTLFLFFVGFGILIDQYLNWGIWWSWSDFLHHENFAAIFFSVAAGIYVSTRLWRRRK